MSAEGGRVKTIYIVQGYTGEYSDHREWLVLAFFDQVKAQAHVLNLEAELLRLGLKYDGEMPPWDKRDSLSGEMEKLDPNFKCDYTGAGYHILSVELSE